MVNIKWHGVDSPGFKVDKPSWKTGDNIITAGYKTTREVVSDDGTRYNVGCEVNKSPAGDPLYVCKATKDSEEKKFSAINPRTAMKAALEFIGAFPKKRWNGDAFFGLNMKDVQKKLGKTKA